MNIAGAYADDGGRNADAAKMHLACVRAARRDEVLVFDFVGLRRILNVLYHAAVSQHCRIEDAKQCALTQLAELALVTHHVVRRAGIQSEENIRLNQIG